MITFLNSSIWFGEKNFSTDYLFQLKVKTVTYIIKEPAPTVYHMLFMLQPQALMCLLGFYVIEQKKVEPPKVNTLDL